MLEESISLLPVLKSFPLLIALMHNSTLSHLGKWIKAASVGQSYWTSGFSYILQFGSFGDEKLQPRTDVLWLCDSCMPCLGSCALLDTLYFKKPWRPNIKVCDNTDHLSTCCFPLQDYIFYLEPERLESGKGKCSYDPKVDTVSALISEFQ